MNNTPSLTLDQIADMAMTERGFLPDYPREVVQQVDAMPDTLPYTGSPRDLRDKLWFSIDNPDSKDLDQLTYAEASEDGSFKAYIAVADVDSRVAKLSPTDKYAAHNTTSVYTPTKIFPMLPIRLSTDLTSLNPGVDRQAMVVEVKVSADGSFSPGEIYRALVHNKAKLSYPIVSDFLEQDTPLPEQFDEIRQLGQNVHLQDRIAQAIEQHRNKQGALGFETIEYFPEIVDGKPVGIREAVHRRADSLIENFMIAANVCVTLTLQRLGRPTLQRIVRQPKNWDRIVALARLEGIKLPKAPDSVTLMEFLNTMRARDPLRFPDLSLSIIKLIGRGEYVVIGPHAPTPGHFDLALREYAHTTAPNRRFPDLVMQRLLKCGLDGVESPYTLDDLDQYATHCTQKEDDATKVERRVRKSAAAMVLSSKIGHRFEGLVTGAAEKGTWVRLLHPPVEGRLVHGCAGLDVGDCVTVTLVSVDVLQGHINLAAC